MVLVDNAKGRGPVHVRRKIFHLCLGTVFLLSMITWYDLKWFFLGTLAFGIMLSYTQEKKKLPVITWFLDRYDKSSDHVPGQGPLTFFAGAVLVWFLFPETIAFASIMVLTFGDPMAYLGGRLMGGPKLPWNRSKTLSGMMSFMIFPFVLVLLIIGPVEAILISIIGGFVESIKWPDNLLADDNIIIPVGTALSVWLLSILFHIF